MCLPSRSLRTFLEFPYDSEMWDFYAETKSKFSWFFVIFPKISGFGCGKRWPWSFPIPLETAEMDDSDIELSKKSKIIGIGSVEKKLQLFKVGGFSKKSENPGIFVQLIYFSENKTVLVNKNWWKSWKSCGFYSLSVLMR